MDKKIVTTCAACWTCLFREMALMLDYALNELISPPSLVCKKNSSHLHSLRVGFLFNCTDLGKNWCKLRHFTIPFPRKSENQVLGLTSKWPTDHECQNKLFLLIFLTIGPLSWSWSRGTKPPCWGVRKERSGTRQAKKLTLFKVVISYVCRAIIRRKIRPKEIPSCYIPCLLVAFTQQLEILETSLVCLLPMRVSGCLPFTRTYHSVHGLDKW